MLVNFHTDWCNLSMTFNDLCLLIIVGFLMLCFHLFPHHVFHGHPSYHHESPQYSLAPGASKAQLSTKLLAKFDANDAGTTEPLGEGC